MFLTAIQKHVIEDFAANNDIMLIPRQIYIYAKDQELPKSRMIKLSSSYKASLLGFLVVKLPTKHKGGNLVVHNGNTKEELEFAPESCANTTIEWLAFKSNCEFEVLPVTEGTCTLLVYCIQRVELKRDESKICAFCNKYPPKKESRLENNLNEGIEDIVKEFTKNLRCHIDEYGFRTNKIGVFLHNQYPMCKLEPTALKGVDLLIYQEFDDFDIFLTPVLCCSGGMVLSKNLIELEKLVFHQHTVYSFTMEDLDRLNDTESPEMKPEEDIDFYGWRNDAEVLLNNFSIEENFCLMEPGKSFRWYHRSAMIITKRTKKGKTKRKDATKKLGDDNRNTKGSLMKTAMKAEDLEIPSSTDKAEKIQKNTAENPEEEDAPSGYNKAERCVKGTPEKSAEVEDVTSGAEETVDNRKNATEKPDFEDVAVKDVTSVIKLEDEGEESEGLASFLSEFTIESDV